MRTCPSEGLHMFRSTSPFRLGQILCILGVALSALMARPGAAQAQTYTSAGGANFTNIQAWNFGAGPIPFSDPIGSLTFQSFGTTGYTANTDLNFTLQTLRLNTF